MATIITIVTISIFIYFKLRQKAPATSPQKLPSISSPVPSRPLHSSRSNPENFNKTSRNQSDSVTSASENLELVRISSKVRMQQIHISILPNEDKTIAKTEPISIVTDHQRILSL